MLGQSVFPLLVPPMAKTLVVPKLHEPLLSVAEVCDGGHSVLFTGKGVEVYGTQDLNIDASAVGSGYRKGNLYYLPSKVNTSPTNCYSVSSGTDNSLLGYHQRFNHIGVKSLKHLL